MQLYKQADMQEDAASADFNACMVQPLLTYKPVVLMAPVGVIWEGDVHKAGMAVVAKHRWGWGVPRLLPQHARKVRRLNNRIYVRYLQAITLQS